MPSVPQVSDAQLAGARSSLESANLEGGANRAEGRAVAGLAALYAFRMLGLFIVLPVIQILGRDYSDATPVLVGLAMGIYGGTQALLQIPFGWLSDRLGRKPVILAGLGLFILGSVIAALADTITAVIIGRALQGAGAISAAVMALLADLTRDERRSQAMAAVGGAIGLSFALALFIGPLLGERYGLSGIFWFSALLGLAGALIVLFVVPRAPLARRSQSEVSPRLQQFWTVLKHPGLARLNAGIFVLHLVLMVIFTVIPLTLLEFGWALERHWQVYLPVMGLSFVAMLPLIILAERAGKMKPVFLLAIAVMSVSLLAASFSLQNELAFLAALFFLFFGFNLLEAQLPSLVSKMAPAGFKGMALGIYASGQFLGVFIGATVAGALVGLGQAAAALWFAALLMAALLLLASGLQVPANLRRVLVPLPQAQEREAFLRALENAPGVHEMFCDEEAEAVVLRVDKAHFDPARVSGAKASKAGSREDTQA